MSPSLLTRLAFEPSTHPHAHATLTDPPRGEEYWVAACDEFQHATDLVKYIRQHHGDHFCIGVAGEFGSRLFPLSLVLPPISSFLPTYRSFCARTRSFNLRPPTPRTGYPEGHADSEDKQMDVDYLLQKQEAGAEFVVTQLFYDVATFMEWYRACRDRGAFGFGLSSARGRGANSSGGEGAQASPSPSYLVSCRFRIISRSDG